MNPSLSLFDESILQHINIDFSVENLDNNCQFTEGPVWNKEGYYLFSDITANCVYKIAPGKNKEKFIGQSGATNTADEDLKPDQIGSNGLAYGPGSPNLVVCRHGSHMIGEWNGS